MNKRLLKRLLPAMVVIVVLGAAALYVYTKLTSPLSFAYYEPTYIPEGIEITDKRIMINDNGTARHESASLRLEKVAWSYSISQYKKDSGTKIESSDQNYDEKSDDPTCSHLKTPKRLEYRLCHWIDNWESHGGSKVGVHEVKFFKGNTYFWGRIPTGPNEPISVDEIAKFIDSFERKSTDGIPVKESRYFSLQNGPLG